MNRFNNKKLIRSSLLTFGLLFIASITIANINELSKILTEIKLIYFILSIFMSLTGSFLTSLIMRELFLKYEISIDCILCHKIFFYSQITKYIPGKIWSIYYQKTLFDIKSNIKNGSYSAIIFTNIELSISVVNIVTFISLFLIVSTYSKTLSFFIFTLGIASNAIIINHCYIYKYTKKIFSLSKKLNNLHMCDCNLQNKYLITFFYFISFSIIYFFSNYIMMLSAFNFSINENILYISYMSISWVVGVISFVIPGGFGIKELTFISLSNFLSTDVPVESLISIAIIHRFWIIIQELIGASLISIYSKISFYLKNK